jgi:hypothetical protein
MTVQVAADGTLEVLSPFHWWCRECGRWEICDDADRCGECAWMREQGGSRPLPPPRRKRERRREGRAA